MADQSTISTYDSKAEDYVEFAKETATDPILLSFIEKVKPQGYVLDLGCGPAFSANEMRKAGLTVDPVDASSRMVEIANQKFDIGARIATFDEIDGQEIYNGVWANFSLLHAKPDDFPRHLDQIFQAVVPGGVFNIAMKTGRDTKRDTLNRFYAYYSRSELTDLLSTAGFCEFDCKTGSAPGMAGKSEPWIAITCSKPDLPTGSKDRSPALSK